MERLTTALAGCLAFVALHAQPVSESAPDPAFVRKRVRNKEIGLRTGLNLFTSPLHDGQYASVPLQFSWRSGVRRMPTSSPDGCYYNGTWYPDRDMAAPPSAGSFSKPSCRRFLRCSNCMRA